MSVFTKQGLKALKEKADSRYQSTNMVPISTFYRNKQSGYFKEIKDKYNNVMYPYVKDNNGDPKCPANGRIKGLFYNGKRKNGSIPGYFLFGDKRVIVPVHQILTSDSRLYFSDFWCHSNEHHITVVVAKPGTDEDRFCQEYLLQLNSHKNGYLEIDQVTREVSINCSTWVEVFSTAALDLKKDGIKWDTGHCPRLSTPGGMPKKRSCTTCNLREQGIYITTAPPLLPPDTFSDNRVPERPEFIVIQPPPADDGETSNESPKPLLDVTHNTTPLLTKDDSESEKDVSDKPGDMLIKPVSSDDEKSATESPKRKPDDNITPRFTSSDRESDDESEPPRKRPKVDEDADTDNCKI